MFSGNDMKKNNKILKKYGSIAKHPWSGFKNIRINPYDKSKIIEQFTNFRESIDEIENKIKIFTDSNPTLKIFNKVEEIVNHFVEVRLKWYDTRKAYLIAKLVRELLIISNKARFIKDIIDGKLTVNNAPKKSIILYLEANKFDKVDGSYNYLLNMPIYSLTKERFDELLKQEADKKAEKKIIEGTNPKDMYLSDLETLKKAIK